MSYCIGHIVYGHDLTELARTHAELIDELVKSELATETYESQCLYIGTLIMEIDECTAYDFADLLKKTVVTDKVKQRYNRAIKKLPENAKALIAGSKPRVLLLWGHS